jgi:hypothetical protein
LPRRIRRGVGDVADSGDGDELSFIFAFGWYLL